MTLYLEFHAVKVDIHILQLSALCFINYIRISFNFKTSAFYNVANIFANHARSNGISMRNALIVASRISSVRENALFASQIAFLN